MNEKGLRWISKGADFSAFMMFQSCKNTCKKVTGRRPNTFPKFTKVEKVRDFLHSSVNNYSISYLYYFLQVFLPFRNLHQVSAYFLVTNLKANRAKTINKMINSV